MTGAGASRLPGGPYGLVLTGCLGILSALPSCAGSEAKGAEARPARYPGPMLDAGAEGPRGRPGAETGEATEVTASDASVDVHEAPEGAAPDSEAPMADVSPDAVPRPGLCDRSGDDPVRDAFCGEERPVVRGVADLRRTLRIDDPDDPGVNPFTGVGDVTVLLGLSTALSGKLISPINPRMIAMNHGVTMAFQRGVQQVEIAATDRQSRAISLFLVTFRQACNERETGCLPGELYTPELETGWRDVRVQDAEDLKNTPSDCRQCHQRGLDEPVLLMRELSAPWTHFFGGPNESQGIPGVNGGDLLLDYIAAKGDEVFGGVAASDLNLSPPFALEATVVKPQPLLFDAPNIMRERFPYSEMPESEAPPRSPTWDYAYAAFKRGENLALPHFDGRPTDPDKQAALTAAYARYRAGEIDATELPDLADIFPDDPMVRAEIGLQTEPGATPAEVLIQACASCHNDVLDQSISRALFSVDLSRMSRDELQRAVARISLEPDAPGVMPPPEARSLTDEARGALIEYLDRDQRTPQDDAMLLRAAQLGMAGSGLPEPANDP